MNKAVTAILFLFCLSSNVLKATLASIALLKQGQKKIVVLGDRLFTINRNPIQSAALSSKEAFTKLDPQLGHSVLGYFDARDRYLVSDLLCNLQQYATAFIYTGLDKSLLAAITKNDKNAYLGMGALWPYNPAYGALQWQEINVGGKFFEFGYIWDAFIYSWNNVLKDKGLTCTTVEALWATDAQAKKRFFTQDVRDYKVVFKKIMDSTFKERIKIKDIAPSIKEIISSLKNTPVKNVSYQTSLNSYVKILEARHAQVILLFNSFNHPGDVSLDEFLFELFERSQSFLKITEIVQGTLAPLFSVLVEALTMHKLYQSVELQEYTFVFTCEGMAKTIINQCKEVDFEVDYTIATYKKEAATLEKSQEYLLDSYLIEKCFSKIVTSSACISSTTNSSSLPREVESIIECFSCKEALSPHQAIVTLPSSSDSVCSKECFLDWYVQAGPSVTGFNFLLNTISDKKLLEFLYLALFFNAYMLNPLLSCVKLEDISYDVCKFFELWKKDTIYYLSENNPLITQILSLASIDRAVLSDHLTLVYAIKRKYLKELFFAACNSCYDTFSLKDDLLYEFDACLKVVQSSYKRKLVNNKNFAVKLTDIKLILLYKQLVSLVKNKLTSTPNVANILNFFLNPMQENLVPGVVKQKKEKKIIKKIPLQNNNKQEIQTDDSYCFDTDIEVPYIKPSDSTQSPKAPLCPFSDYTKKQYVRLSNIFAHQKSTITLFNIKKIVPKDRCISYGLVAPFEYHHRINLLWNLEGAWRTNEAGCEQSSSTLYGVECLAFNTMQLHESIAQKLDMHHLFSKTVDAYALAYGIFESVDDDKHIQLSVPGVFSFDNGSSRVGFFQYAFNKKTHLCYHRCFRNYYQTAYISPYLRSCLTNFLDMHKQTLPKHLQSISLTVSCS
ncbi:hypothetical protein H0X48_00615 [Candidatus Dependentiae bacterium]|nr:hypothetical protein [Candidatus Dependentiae bacterium]